MHYKKSKTIKRLSPEALQELADEIRTFLVQSISDTGGHLASNLGVVELTLALHSVFDTPNDKIVWDVGHQAYVHKMLTGRKGRFSSLRKMDGLSGFPKINESEHDAFGTGHSSTAISAALGLAKARDLQGDSEESVIAVVGDGSVTGGLAYEGLNNAGRANTDLLVILNDNGMSISKNVGAVARHLNTLRTAPMYLGAKEDVHFLLDKLPVLGASITRGIESAKDMIKYAVLPGVLFEELGFRYIGPVDGHDIPALLRVLRQIKKIKGAVLLHVLTTKGKGYNIAEKSPKNYHGVGTFCVKTGEPTVNSTKPTYTDIFSKYICRAASKDERIVAITAAMHDGTGLSRFKERFPKRFFDVGIAESHAVTFAAGLAKGGMKPVVAVYSSFLQRAYDQILHDVAIQNLPVVFAIDHAGAVGGDGETHQGIFDIAFLSHIPNMTILAPSGSTELVKMLDFAFAQNSPVAIRYPKEIAEESKKVLQEGEKIAIVSMGTMYSTAKEVADMLCEKTGLYDAGFVKPFDEGLIAALEKYEYVFTIEDGVRSGGFGERLGAVLNNPICHAFGFPDIFPETGTRKELFARYNLDAESIYNKIEDIARSCRGGVPNQNKKETTNGKQKKT
jgi:1-deoxy-D-xylulose-5-phosphate synthase